MFVGSIVWGLSMAIYTPDALVAPIEFGSVAVIVGIA
jgi:hypothetical protein